MKKRNPTRVTTREKVRRTSDPVPWRYCLLTLVCGILLVAGFFLAARTHFSSIEYGMKNVDLKKQIEELEAEKRQLLLAKEVALSPGEIKKNARKMGFREMTAANIEAYRISTFRQDDSLLETPVRDLPPGDAAERSRSLTKPSKPSPAGAAKNARETPGDAKKSGSKKDLNSTEKRSVQSVPAPSAKKETGERPQTQIARK